MANGIARIANLRLRQNTTIQNVICADGCGSDGRLSRVFFEKCRRIHLDDAQSALYL
jgi:hypothetical protein